MAENALDLLDWYDIPLQAIDVRIATLGDAADAANKRTWDQMVQQKGEWRSAGVVPPTWHSPVGSR